MLLHCRVGKNVSVASRFVGPARPDRLAQLKGSPVPHMFISYRREGSLLYAGRLYDGL